MNAKKNTLHNAEKLVENAASMKNSVFKFDSLTPSNNKINITSTGK